MAARDMSDPREESERSDFPIVCQTCLGPSPYIRMQKIEMGGQCHISGRPYTVFRWRPGNEARYKKTVICQEVAKAKNVCQVCLLDLEYGLPVQVRDAAMGAAAKAEEIPQSEVGIEFQLNEAVQAAANGAGDSSFAKGRPSEMLARLQRSQPYYKRNEARICSFFVRGMCNRGAECPYRHEMPTYDKDLSEQNYKDRYYGINDPVALKMMRRAEGLGMGGAGLSGGKLTPPEDKSIKTLYVGGVSAGIDDSDLRAAFEKHGEVVSLRMKPTRFCAFVEFATRESAEAAAEALAGKLEVRGARLTLMWARGSSGAVGGGAADPMEPMQASGGADGGVGPGPSSAASLLVQPVGGAPPGGASAYPSMRSDSYGSARPGPGDKRGAAEEGGGGNGDAKRARAPPPGAPPGGPPPGAPTPGYGLGPPPPGSGYGVMPPQHPYAMAGYYGGYAPVPMMFGPPPPMAPLHAPGGPGPRPPPPRPPPGNPPTAPASPPGKTAHPAEPAAPGPAAPAVAAAQAAAG